MQSFIFRYSIHDLKGEKKYMLNMEMKVCVQKGGGSCLFTTKLFRGEDPMALPNAEIKKNCRIPHKHHTCKV
jgi:hypothetical protein